ncbi:MAG: hypothetical protein JRE64_01975 [Deltaproteobacteria bacterium]|nr:hypothetical protein [Deltaproteobacteria bacterium]
MKVLKKKHGFLIIISLFFMVAGLIFVPTKAMAQTTQGDVALNMAKLLGFEVTTTEEGVWAIQAVGIALKGGWNMSATVTPDFIDSLYLAVNNAITQGTLIPPSALGSASALVAAAATAAGMSSTTAVKAVVAVGGTWASASQGASYGTVLTPGQATTPTTPTPSGPGGGAAGGGGGTTSPSL